MRAHAATFAVAIMSVLLGTASAHGAPADVRIRIEGASSTIVDRLVRVDGHDVRARSDVQARRCDGTNANRSPTPGPTATGATVDALASIGQDFDGDWYAGFDDYFVTRLGPEAEDNGRLWWWGILVNRAFSPVGGCQVQVHDGDEVLWVLDAFSNRPFLWLAGPGSAPTVGVGQPLSVTVTSTTASTSQDQASGSPYAGARVEAVDENGQPAAAGIVDGGVSGADGSANVVFHRAGWQRLKARNPGSGDHPLAIASNSIDVCVEAAPDVGCDGTPPSRRPVDVPRPGGRASVPPSSGHVRLAAPRLALDPGRGRVTARWSVRDAGLGIRDWRIASQTLGHRDAAWVTRGGGGPSATRATLKLPTGATSRLRLSVRDVAGGTTTLALGRVLVPSDDRALHPGAGWTLAHDRDAWMGTIARARAGATLTLRLGRGQPAFLVRSGSTSASVELRVGRRVLRHAVAGGSPARSRQLLAPRLDRAGTVELRVRTGTVSLDGVGLAP